ncbi:hypothetical protein F5141DRAFT_1191401 [Pisolithus sp. B1]|nr:hypothetical protein F5141DRAFT_1191401 [Pisolithus sp. B1]
MLFENAHSLLKYVDKLHTGLAWTCEMIDVEGDIIAEDGTLKHKQLELWWHDPVECMQELMGNPAFWEVMLYVPKHAYTDAKGENCIYDEMWTGDWWWNVQKKLPEGAMVAPVILLSDKMTLPVQCQVLAHAMLLIGYLPVSKLECFQKKTQSLVGYHLFHHAMSLLLHPLMDAGCQGREMICTDGYLCSVHPILTTYIADFPEQCLVACNKESRCPCCLVQSNKCGDLEDWASCSMANMLKTLQKFDVKGLHAVFDPFWKELPFTNIFACLTPNILHQLHKGIFHDHLLQWCMSIVSEKEIDACFQAMTQYPTLCHFKKGVSSVSQWTGTEHKEMQRVFVSLLAGAVDDHVLIVIHSLLDFIFYAQLQQHMDTTLAAMKASLKTFHNHKHIHSLQHYISLIQALGSADSYNTKYPEQLHIDYAKDSYHCRDNKHNYVEQMALWLQCQEAMHYKSAYLAWRRPCAATCEHSDDDSPSAKEKGVSSLPNVAVLQMSAHYKVAKTPPHCHVSINCIENDYLALEFLPTLEQFLVSQLGQCQVIQPIRSDWFDVYNHLIISGHGQSLQKIHALCRIAAHGREAKIPARSDTLAQVRVIFNLPDHFGSYPHPLAYIKWFTALQQCDLVSSLYIITHSTRNHCCNVAVISIDHIICPCHLLVWCGREIGKDWTTDSVLEKATSFYVNSYIDLDTFLSLE